MSDGMKIKGRERAPDREGPFKKGMTAKLVWKMIKAQLLLTLNQVFNFKDDWFAQKEGESRIRIAQAEQEEAKAAKLRGSAVPGPEIVLKEPTEEQRLLLESAIESSEADQADELDNITEDEILARIEENLLVLKALGHTVTILEDESEKEAASESEDESENARFSFQINLEHDSDLESENLGEDK